MRSTALPLLLFALLAPVATAAPTLRLQLDLRGDLVLVGNTLAHDCGPGVPAPLVGTVGGCGNNLADTAPDVFWRGDSPGFNQAEAGVGITPANARTTAVLGLPNGARVAYARLYWAARNGAPVADLQITVERPGGFAPLTVTADGSWVDLTYYQASADVTNLVKSQGSGAYRVSGVDAVNLVDRVDDVAFVGWALVVVYELPAAPPRHFLLVDGFDAVEPMSPLTVGLDGFLAPGAAVDGKLAVLAYEGDQGLAGDTLLWGGTALTDGQNPADNFFNGTHSQGGVAQSPAGARPRLTGTPGSLSGLDLDVVDVSARIQPGDTQATVSAESQGDVFWIGALAAAVATRTPLFTEARKTAVDLNGGALRPGDVVEYTITAANDGNDGAKEVQITDGLPPGVSFLPGSLQVHLGPNLGPKTDQAGDDAGEYDAPTRTVRARLGAGANAQQGGQVAVGEQVGIKFRVTIDGDAAGAIANQARLLARGAASGAPVSFRTSDGPTQLDQATTITVAPCQANTDCGGATPRCDRQRQPPRCAPCAGDGDCGGATPACQPGGACGECSQTNRSRCFGKKPICALPGGLCRGCKGDLECGGQTPACQGDGSCNQCSQTNQTLCAGQGCDVAAGICRIRACARNQDCPGTTPVCDLKTFKCRPCAADGECGGAAPACQPSGACGQCSAGNKSLCLGVTPICDLAIGRCRGCRGDGDCRAPSPACQPGGACGECNAGNRTQCRDPKPQCEVASGRCAPCALADAGGPACAQSPDGRICFADPLGGLPFCGCRGDGDCGAKDSGRICDEASRRCTGGCSAAPQRNRCPPGFTCTSGDQTGKVVGSCSRPCADDRGCAATPATPFCVTRPDLSRLCVQCRTDGDCGARVDGRTKCADDTRLCVECTDQRRDACLAAGKGLQCLSGRVCGCLRDTDCGGFDSGRVCDVVARRCGPGCRGQNGNGCPAGQSCTSVDTRPGRCVGVARPDLAMARDAGVDADEEGGEDGAVVEEGSYGLAGGGVGCSVGRQPSTSLLGLAALLLAVVTRRRRGR